MRGKTAEHAVRTDLNFWWRKVKAAVVNNLFVLLHLLSLLIGGVLNLFRHRDLLRGGGGATQAFEAGEEEGGDGGFACCGSGIRGCMGCCWGAENLLLINGF
ncbi:hypothetical protein FF1_022683 [Malus domestica]